MTHQELSALYSERITAIYPLIRHRARFDEDLEQIGRMSVFEGLMEKPDAKDNWLKNRAKWAINTQRKRGRSLDFHPMGRKIQPDILRLDDPDSLCDGFSLLDVIPADTGSDPETQAINSISLERFFSALTSKEATYTRLKVNEERPDSIIRQLTGWTQEGIRAMKESIRAKMEMVFAS